MRIRIIWGIIFCSLLSISATAGSAMVPVSDINSVPLGKMHKKITSIKIKDIQKSIGRKLTLKEKISFFILKQKLRHQPKESVNAGDVSLILGIAGLVFLALYFLVGFYFMIPAVASAIVAIVTGHRTRKKDPANKNAKIGKLLGWVTVGLITAFFIAILIAFASIGSWSFG
jgi:Na+/H+ antiporter NhaD/arsenite permease-like protein